jgi:hypothetical protein
MNVARSSVVACFFVFALVGIARADETSDLKAKLDALQKQMDVLRTQLEQVQTQVQAQQQQQGWRSTGAPPPSADWVPVFGGRASGRSEGVLSPLST